MMQAAQHSLLPHDDLPQQGEQRTMAQQIQARVQATPGAVDLTPIRQRVGRTDRLTTGRLPLLSRLLRRLHPGAFLSWSASTELLYAQRRRTGAATALADAGFVAPFADATVASARVVIPPAAHSTPPPVAVARKPGRTLGQPVVGDSPVPVAPQTVAAPLPSAHAPQQAAVTPSRGVTVHSVPVALPSVMAAAPDLPVLARALAASAEARVMASPMLRPAAEHNPAPPDHVPASTAVLQPASQASRGHPSSTLAYTGNLGAAIVQRHLRQVDSHAVGSSQATMTVASLALALQPSTVSAAHAQPVTALPVNAPRVGTSGSPTARPHAQALPTAAPVKIMAGSITAGTMVSHPPGEQPIVDRGLGLAVQRAAERSIDHAHRENEAQPAAIEQTGALLRLTASAALPPSTPSVALSLHRSPSAGRDDTPLGAASATGVQRASALAPQISTGLQRGKPPVAPNPLQSVPAGGDAVGQAASPKQTVAMETPAAQVKSEGEAPLLLRQPTRSPLPAVPPMAEVKRQSAPAEQPGFSMIGRSAPAGQVLTQRMQQAFTQQSKPGQSGTAPQAGSPQAQPAYPSPPTVGAAAPVTMPPPVDVAGPGAALIMTRRTGKFGAPIVQRRLHERTTLNSSIAGLPRTDPPHATVAPVIAQPVASTLASPLPLLTPPAATPSAVSVQRAHPVAGDALAGTSPSVGVAQHGPAQTMGNATSTVAAPTIAMADTATSTRGDLIVSKPVVQPKAADPAISLIWQREQQSPVAAELDTQQPVQRDRPAPSTGARPLAAAGTVAQRTSIQQGTAHAVEPDVAPSQRHSLAPTLSVPVHPVRSSTAAPALAPAPASVWRTSPGVQTLLRGAAPMHQAVTEVVGDQPVHPAGAKGVSAPAHRQRHEAATGGISRSVVVEQLAQAQAADQTSSFAEGATIQARGRTNDALIAAPALPSCADLGAGHAARLLVWAHPATVTAPVGGLHLSRRVVRATTMTATATQPRTSVADPISPHAMPWSRRSTAAAALPSSVAMPVLFAHQPAAQITPSLAAQETQDAAVGQPNSDVDLPLASPMPTSTLHRRRIADQSSNVLSARILRRYLAYPAAQGLAAQGSSESAADAYEPLPVALTVGGYPPTTAAALGQLSAPLERWPGANGDSSITAGRAVQDGSLSQGQQPAASLPLLLQRAAREATAGESPPPSSAVTASPSSAAMSTTEIARVGQEEDELERLADRVYALIEQRLIIERESMGM